MKAFRKPPEDFLEKLKLMAPGTELYQGIENVLRAKTGALIVIGYNEEVARIVTGALPSMRISPPVPSMSWPRWTAPWSSAPMPAAFSLPMRS